MPGSVLRAECGTAAAQTAQADCDVRRTIGPVTATGIVVANMIGSGVFVTTGILAENVPGPAAVLCCWLLGGFIAVSGALCYAELATRMPQEGGEYVYLSRLFHPLLGFLSGWVSFLVGFSAPIAASAIGFAAYLFAGLDIDTGVPHWIGTTRLQQAVAVAIVTLFTLLHYTGVRRGALIQNVLTVTKVVVIFCLAGAGLVWGQGSWSNLRHDGVVVGDGFALGTAMMLVMFAYSGWNASAYVAGEIRNPQKNVPASLVSGTAIVILLYLTINLFVLRSLPFEEVQGEVAVVERAAVSALGEWIGNSFGIIVALALLSSISAFVMIGPRIYYAMAREGLFIRFAGQVHPTYGVPSRSILLQGAFASLMVVCSSIEQLVVLLIYALNVFPWLAVLGLFIARRRRIGESTAVRVPCYPLLPLCFLGSTLTLAIVAYLNRPAEATAAVLMVLAGVPAYYLWRMRCGSRFVRSVLAAKASSSHRVAAVPRADPGDRLRGSS